MNPIKFNLKLDFPTRFIGFEHGKSKKSIRKKWRKTFIEILTIWKEINNEI